MQHDPMDEFPSPYVVMGNNPTIFTDPFGLSTQDHIGYNRWGQEVARAEAEGDDRYYLLTPSGEGTWTSQEIDQPYWKKLGFGSEFDMELYYALQERDGNWSMLPYTGRVVGSSKYGFDPIARNKQIDRKDADRKSLEKDISRQTNKTTQDQRQYDIDKAATYLTEHAYPKYSKSTCGNCAKAVRKAMEAGGLSTTGRPTSAKNYGPFLKTIGFSSISRLNYDPIKGDIRVFQNYPGGSIHGHIDMFNGSRWISDYKENAWPGRGYALDQNYRIFRYDYRK